MNTDNTNDADDNLIDRIIASVHGNHAGDHEHLGDAVGRSGGDEALLATMDTITQSIGCVTEVLYKYVERLSFTPDDVIHCVAVIEAGCIHLAQQIESWRTRIQSQVKEDQGEGEDGPEPQHLQEASDAAGVPVIVQMTIIRAG